MRDPLLLTMVVTTVVSAIAAAVQNKVQGDDVRKSAIGGFAGGIFNGAAACLLYVLLT